MIKNKLVIGISGVAQSGKDTFFQLSSRYLYEEFGISSKRYALADFLKDECKDFLKEKFGLDVYSQKIEDKEIFRPFLVWFGDVKRERTHGKFFTTITEKQILSDDVDVAFITDIRYGEYPEDEAQWVKNSLNGSLIHLQRTDKNGNLIVPPNDNEKRNDPIMYKEADIRFEWSTHFESDDPRFEDKMYNRWKSTLAEIYFNRLRLGIYHDPATKQAMAVAENLLEE